MYWKTRINFTDDELKILNLLSNKYGGSSESTEQNILKELLLFWKPVNNLWQM